MDEIFNFDKSLKEALPITFIPHLLLVKTNINDKILKRNIFNLDIYLNNLLINNEIRDSITFNNFIKNKYIIDRSKENNYIFYEKINNTYDNLNTKIDINFEEFRSKKSKICFVDSEKIEKITKSKKANLIYINDILIKCEDKVKKIKEYFDNIKNLNNEISDNYQILHDYYNNINNEFSMSYDTKIAKEFDNIKKKITKINEHISYLSTHFYSNINGINILNIKNNILFYNIIKKKLQFKDNIITLDKRLLEIKEKLFKKKKIDTYKLTKEDFESLKNKNILSDKQATFNIMLPDETGFIINLKKIYFMFNNIFINELIIFKENILNVFNFYGNILNNKCDKMFLIN